MNAAPPQWQIAQCTMEGLKKSSALLIFKSKQSDDLERLGDVRPYNSATVLHDEQVRLGTWTPSRWVGANQVPRDGEQSLDNAAFHFPLHSAKGSPLQPDNELESRTLPTVVVEGEMTRR